MLQKSFALNFIKKNFFNIHVSKIGVGMISAIKGTLILDELKQNNVLKQIKKEESEKSWFEEWLCDEDKVSTDGFDDGKISFEEAMKSFGKGLIGIVKSVIKHPIITLTTIGLGTAATIATGGAVMPVFVTAGTILGAGQLAYGIFSAANAQTDKDAKIAFETMGNATFSIASSALSAKSALNMASKAGVSSAKNFEELNTIESVIQCFKSSPEAIMQSGANIKGNYLTLTTGTIHANSNALRKGQVEYMSNPNEAQAYRFNPFGSEEEILKNNPGVFKGQDGKFYVKNKWNPDAPFLIDPSKEQMIMIYGPDDMAVCDGGIFSGSYVDSGAFKTGELKYQKPTELEYGKIVEVTKQAKGAFKIVEEGTKVATLEGVTSVKEGQVIAIDHEGNPYVQTMNSILKRNHATEKSDSILGFKKLQERMDAGIM